MSAWNDRMNLDDLKTQWKLEMQQVVPTPDFGVEKIQRDVAEFNRSVRFNNFWAIFGLTSASALGVFFGWVAMDGAGWLSKLTIATNVVATLWIIVMLLRARRVGRSDDWTLRSRLETEIERLEKQRNLWKYGGLWFLAPMFITVLLGLPVRLYWVWFVLCGVVYWTVRHGTRTRTDPLLSRLKELHRELVDSE
jgi:hypothetical protein